MAVIDAAAPGPRKPRRSLFALLREGARHRPGGAWGVLIAAGSVAAAIYVIWVGALATITGDGLIWLAAELKQAGYSAGWLDALGTWSRAFAARYHIDISIFIAITFPIAFLTTTARHTRKHLAWTDVVLAALSLAVALYYIIYNQKFLNWNRGMDTASLADTVVGFVLVGLVVELCRRCTGWGLTTLVAVLLAYTYFGDLLPGALKHENFTVPYFIEMMTIMENGIFGAPLEVAATYAFLFVLFGSFYERAGGGQLFFDLAGAVTGRMRGGAAKACVTASGLYGSVSGSPTADVATTGPLTIPIMIRTGVPPARAGAIEATASSGGAMLPPVMGAVAFIMSDLTNISYASIAWASLLPAIFYYAAIYLLVHNEAIRNDERPMAEADIVGLATAIRRGWRHLLPLGALIGLLIEGYTPVYVAAGSTAAVIVLSWLSPSKAIGPRRFVECCTSTITQLVPLVGAVAAAGVVIGAIEISGLAGKFTLLITYLSGGYLVSTLIMAALFLILLGMGMPTPAVYVTGAALLVPTLRQEFNLPEMQTHLFILYFACLSAITPPVAVANFAAGAIAGVNPMSLGSYAVKLAVGGFVLPFFFLFHPGLNMQGGIAAIAPAIVFAAAMVACASFALQGWLGRQRIALPLRLLLAAAAIGTIDPRIEVQSAAAAIGAAILLGTRWLARPVDPARP
ncbi:MAG: TRAP transporter fused permease subunit [Rhodospirillaceae bacterium]|nr:TRAP transporter fused permease subunit [Rhodospirillaceae bacterium]